MELSRVVLYPPTAMKDQKRALVGELAALAHLELDANELEAFGAQLDDILAYIQCLASVDVDGVPEYQGGAALEQARSSLRDDVTGEDFDADAALAGVPHRRDRFVAVPKFKTDAGEG